MRPGGRRTCGWNRCQDVTDTCSAENIEPPWNPTETRAALPVDGGATASYSEYDLTIWHFAAAP